MSDPDRDVSKTRGHRGPRRPVISISFVALAALARPAAAEDLDVEPLRDGLIVAGAGAWALLDALVLEDELAPRSCRWCDDSLNGFDAALRRLRWQSPDRADAISDATAYLVTPLAL